MDIVIVLDGSNSIYPWSEVQNFLKNILSKFHISPEQMQVCVLNFYESTCRAGFVFPVLIHLIQCNQLDKCERGNVQ